MHERYEACEVIGAAIAVSTSPSSLFSAAMLQQLLQLNVTKGIFLIGLSVVPTDLHNNMQLLKERPWIGGRAILAFEKGPAGDQAFAQAFAAWERE
jgi:hypothetical protein